MEVLDAIKNRHSVRQYKPKIWLIKASVPIRSNRRRERSFYLEVNYMILGGVFTRPSFLWQ